MGESTIAWRLSEDSSCTVVWTDDASWFLLFVDSLTRLLLYSYLCIASAYDLLLLFARF